MSLLLCYNFIYGVIESQSLCLSLLINSDHSRYIRSLETSEEMLLFAPPSSVGVLIRLKLLLVGIRTV